MKNVVKIAAAVMLLAFSFTAKAQSNGDQYYLQMGRVAAFNCLYPYMNSNYVITGDVQTTGICIVQGSLHKVTFYVSPNCPPGQGCAQYVLTVATVEFGCQNEVTSVTCSN